MALGIGLEARRLLRGFTVECAVRCFLRYILKTFYVKIGASLTLLKWRRGRTLVNDLSALLKTLSAFFDLIRLAAKCRVLVASVRTCLHQL